MLKIFRYSSKLIFLITTLLLLFGLNVEMDIDSGLYFMGGSGISCGMGVERNFKPGFLFFLAITDTILVLSALLILTSEALKNRYIILASLFCIGLFVLNIFWYQPRLFQGYELTEGMNMLDATTGKCYLYHGPHDVLLLLIVVMGLAAILINRRLKLNQLANHSESR